MNNSFTSPTWGFFVLSMVFLMFKGFGSNPSSSNVTKPGLGQKAVAFLRWIYEVEEIEAMEETPLLVEEETPLPVEEETPLLVEEETPLLVEEETPLPVEEVVVCRTCGSPNWVKSTSCVACGEPLTPLLEETPPAKEETPPAKEETPPTLPILSGNWDKEYPEEWATKLELDAAEIDVSKRIEVATELVAINTALKQQSATIVQNIQKLKTLEDTASTKRMNVKADLDKIRSFFHSSSKEETPKPQPPQEEYIPLQN